MEVDESYQYEDAASIDDFDIDALDEGNFAAGSDDLVDYSDGEDADLFSYIKAEDSQISGFPQAVVSSPNITVRRVVSGQSVSSTQAHRVVSKGPNLIRSTNAAGKVVLIQKSSAATTSAPVKLLNSTKTSTTPGATTSYHLVKSEDGAVMMRPKVTATQPQMIRRIISTSEGQPKSKITAPTHVVIQTKSASSGTTTKTVTVAEAHQMGLLKNKAKPVIARTIPANAVVPKSPIKIVNRNSPTTVVRLKQSPVADGTTQQVLLKSTAASSTKPGISSHKMLISSGSLQTSQQSGQIQAINIPGKGIQYVRFLNKAPTVTKTVSGGPSGKVMPVNAAAPSGSKIIVQNNKTYVVSNGSVTAVRAAPSQRLVGQPVGQTVVRKTVAATSVTGAIRKNPETTRYIAVVKKEDGTSPETVTTLTASQLSQLKGTTVTTGNTKTKILMIPPDQSRNKPAVEGTSSNTSLPSIASTTRDSLSGSSEDELRRGPAVGTIFPDEAYKKRPCNCTKSQCLKLYCDCFANGEFCYNCNCRDCYNNLENEEERQKSIRLTLERNPSAFKPKIGAISATDENQRQHTKGCNCKRSGCLKNYCECYEAKIPCSANCKCIGCRNTEQYAKEYNDYTSLNSSIGGNLSGGANSGLGLTVDYDPESADESMAELSAAGAVAGPSSATATSIQGGTGFKVEQLGATKRSAQESPDLTQLPPSKQPYNFMTPDVIEATVQCMIAQADECQKRGCNIRTAERMILEEFGRCLVEIIEFSTKSDS
ncbi:protein lin-54 homolog [Uranotaenia lowii]|uniref:protein lin-54 homolog n=1 Tax=Uranotaenia lowii TaxID=190385 RepID=UPI00247B0097|nr:protein lin-54 homolog [Uranotaenia lowii]